MGLQESMRVLLVDDDEGLTALLEETFAEDTRFQLVGRAANGLEGVALYEELRPDAVLMDLQMPVLGGIPATKEILSRDASACVIAFTASRDPQEHEAARRAGAAAVLGKPFDPEAFLDAFTEHARSCAARNAA